MDPNWETFAKAFREISFGIYAHGRESDDPELYRRRNPTLSSADGISILEKPLALNRSSTLSFLGCLKHPWRRSIR